MPATGKRIKTPTFLQVYRYHHLTIEEVWRLLFERGPRALDLEDAPGVFLWRYDFMLFC